MTENLLFKQFKGGFCYIRDTAIARAASLGDVGRLDLVLTRSGKSDMLSLVDKIS